MELGLLLMYNILNSTITGSVGALSRKCVVRPFQVLGCYCLSVGSVVGGQYAFLSKVQFLFCFLTIRNTCLQWIPIFSKQGRVAWDSSLRMGLARNHQVFYRSTVLVVLLRTPTCIQGARITFPVCILL